MKLIRIYWKNSYFYDKLFHLFHFFRTVSVIHEYVYSCFLGFYLFIEISLPDLTLSILNPSETKRAITVWNSNPQAKCHSHAQFWTKLSTSMIINSRKNVWRNRATISNRLILLLPIAFYKTFRNLIIIRPQVAATSYTYEEKNYLISMKLAAAGRLAIMSVEDASPYGETCGKWMK